ncbi:hypothetical protein PR048_024322 [Dryococelus australis]|uniref:RNA-directed DNA polymerase n=1 Tax=Dryococelus australis TaxID=614101 RepID=A0ABQ9GNB9_9NEOP|nr:hypothetical protein PR048_024322 [Dryococelus australis]
MGAVLSQKINGFEHSSYFISRQLNKAERNYSTTKREWRFYLYGQKVHVPTSRLDSWSLLLSEYDFDIVHKAGKANVNADALPRIPVHVINLPYEPVWDKEHIRLEQERNPRIAAVKSKVDMGEELGYLFDSDRLLYKFNEDNRNDMFVVPRTLQYKVLTAYHNLPFAGHQGVKCTYDFIKSMFFWDEMSQTFARIASRCCTQTHSKHQTCAPTEVSRGHCSFPEN